MFRPIDSKPDFPALEEGILKFWRDEHIFLKSVEQRKGGPKFIMYEGPPTVNAPPGIHHVLSRVFKDVFPRYRAMKGCYTPRIAGWDTHGLPVELGIESRLGFTSKTQIEAYGIGKFNQLCRESVTSNIGEWNRLTERIGFWVDLDHPYITYNNSFIETCWWLIKQLWDKGLVYQGYRVTPHCPRCGTSLSSHEVALGYKDDTPDPSVYVRFRVVSQLPFAIDSDEPLHLLAWTTTPWTLTANVALAVSPEETYALVKVASKEGQTERLIMAKPLLDQALGKGKWEILAEFTGEDIAGIEYERLFEPRPEFVVSGGKLAPHNRVITAGFVSMDDGTGIVHIAPAYGQDDYDIGQAKGFPVIHTVDLDGNMKPSGKPWEGKFVKEADPLILQDLKSRGLLHHKETIKHTYPFCWRCHTPLLYYAKPSWYIKTTAMKDKLIAGNRDINWYPEYIKEGRFGDWLANNIDWAFSRERYWGTPLPIWRCDRHPEHLECLGSIEEMRGQPGVKGLAGTLDLHRPYVDGVTFDCRQCGGAMKRLPEVLDAWFDSGAMPLAQFHYPFENREEFHSHFPADYICEAIDQTRGWFYTLHALSTLLFEKPCFKNVICLGHILDAKGEKMSKAKGNVVDPWKIVGNQGADALRWYMFTATPPGNVKRFSADLVSESMRKFLSTLWNTYSFFVIYANIDRFDPKAARAPASRPELDRWIVSELNQLIDQVDRAFDGYDPTEAGRRIEEFVDYLSNWYVRRSRRRFWKSGSDEDKLSAYFALYDCLVTVSKLLAPLTPFIAEELYQNLVRSVDPKAPESVHLCHFPAADLSLVDASLSADTRLAMKVSSLGRAARSKAGIKVRQPLASVVIKTRSKSERQGLESLAPQVLEELNVKALAFAEPEADLATQPGYCVAEEGGYAVAVPTAIPPELVDEGIAREIVHRLQTMRRSAGFEIADYIITYYQAEPPLQKAIENLSAYIQQETLSQQLICSPPEEGCHTESHRIDGRTITLGVKKTG